MTTLCDLRKTETGWALGEVSSGRFVSILHDNGGFSLTSRLSNACLFKTKAAAANCAKSLGKGRKWLVAKATIIEELAMERATRVTGA